MRTTATLRNLVSTMASLNMMFFSLELLTFSIRSSDVNTQDENTYSCKCAQNANERYRFAKCLPANAARCPPSTRRSPPVRSGRRFPCMQKRAAKSLVTSATLRTHCELTPTLLLSPCEISLRTYADFVKSVRHQHDITAARVL